MNASFHHRSPLPYLLMFLSLFFFGDPCCYGVFDGSGEVALSPAVFLDGLESELLLQLIWYGHDDSTHFNHLFFIFFTHAGALDFVPISKSPYAKY